MALLPTNMPTLLDHAKRMDPNGKIARIVELLNENNPMLQDMVFLEGNLPTGHKTTVRTGLPEPTWRKLNYGIQPSKSTTAQVTDTCGILEALADVDVDLVELNGNTGEYRLSEETAFREAMNQEMAKTLIYGNEAFYPATFTGLAPRYNSFAAQNAENVIDAGGTGTNNTSIWLVVWGENTAHGIFPKGSKAGLSHEDMGEQMVDAPTEDGGIGKMKAYRSHYKWKAGLTVRDWRYIVRIANVDIAAISSSDTNASALIRSMIQATEKIPSFGMGRASFYCNKQVRTALRLGILEKISSNLSWESVTGKRVMMFDDIPVGRCDALLNTEARVV